MKHFIPLVGLCLAVFLIMSGMGMAVVALPEKYVQASGTMRNSGWLASVFAMSYLLCQYPVGRLADSHGYRGVLAGGCLLLAVAAGLFSMAQTPLWIYAGRFIQGAGEAPVWASAPALLGRLYPDMKGRVMGLYNACFHLGLMLGPGLAAWQLTDKWSGLSDPFVTFSFLCLVAMVLVLCVVRDAADNIGTVSPKASIPTGSKRFCPRLMFCGIPVFGAVYGLLVSCLPVHLVTTAGLPREQLGVFFFAVYAGIAVAQLAGGTLSDRYGRSRFMVGGLALLGCGLLGFVAAPLTPMPGLFIAIGLGAGTFAVSSLALLNETGSDQRKGTVSGYYYLLWGAGYFFGPLLANHLGLLPVTTALAVCALATAGLLAWQAKMKVPEKGKKAEERTVF